MVERWVGATLALFLGTKSIHPVPSLSLPFGVYYLQCVGVLGSQRLGFWVIAALLRGPLSHC